MIKQAASLPFGRSGVTLAATLALAGCLGSDNGIRYGSFSTIRGQPPSPPVVAQPVAVPPQPSGDKPSVLVGASEKRVRDTIIERAQSRKTKIVGENATGVTLEAPLRATTPRLADICGPHRDGRVVRIYLATIGQGARSTLVTEERFVIDTDNTVCAVVLTPEEVNEASNALGALKRQAEAPPARQTTAAGQTTVGGTSFDRR
jgi:hypothetical protein